MCIKITNSDLKSNSMKNPSRKIRSRTRKPKFLSLLRLDSSPANPQLAGKMTHQLNLFPLHPENNPIEEKDLTLIFSSDSAAANLTGILNSGENSSEENSVFSQSLTYAYGGMDSEESSISLVKSAMRSREREKSEEKWVFYSEVVEGKQKKVEDEVTSEFAENGTTNTTSTSCSLSLKLDYDEILNAWSDKGSLYIGGLGQGSQIVPELNDHQLFELDSALMDGLWSVPEKSITTSMDEESNDVGWKIGQREASVLRYREKRQNRLFAKRIRYQVRKLNAEKRPRMKGRFVKRS